jgi:hypothetical protein
MGSAKCMCAWNVVPILVYTYCMPVTSSYVYKQVCKCMLTMTLQLGKVYYCCHHAGCGEQLKIDTYIYTYIYTCTSQRSPLASTTANTANQIGMYNVCIRWVVLVFNKCTYTIRIHFQIVRHARAYVT